MTPPCQNCHGSPQSLPPLSSPERLSQDLPVEAKAPGQTCTAEKHWPEWLKGSFSTELSALPWWTRSNYEKINQAKAKSEGSFSLPFRINIGRADLEVHLFPNTFSFPVKIGSTVLPSEVYVGSNEGGEIQSSLKIRNNQIPLLMQSLLEFKGVSAGLGSGELFETAPQKISVGNLGDLHIILRPQGEARRAIDLITPFERPAMPIGYDMPHGDENIDPRCFAPESDAQAKSLECPELPAWVFPDRSAPDRDFVMTAVIPPELKTSQGRLPKAFDVEDLILRIFKLKDRTKDAPKNPNPPVDLKQILSLDHLKAGSSISLKIDELKDFFLPGLLDLDTSSLKINLTVGKDHELLIDVPELSINSDPMDFPAKNTLQPSEGNECKVGGEVSPDRPGIRLAYANLSAGRKATSRSGQVLEPGIHGVFRPEGNTLELKANLALDTDITLPGLGNVHISGQVLAETSLVFSPDGIKLIPGTTTLQIKDLNILRNPEPQDPAAKKDKDQKPPPHPLTQGEIFFSDDDRSLPLGQGTALTSTKAEGRIELSGLLFEAQTLDFRGNLQIPKNEDGSYKFSGFLENLLLDSELNLTGPKGDRYSAKTSLSSLPVSPAGISEPGDFFFRLVGDLEKWSLKKTKVKNSSELQAVLDKVVEGGRIDFGKNKTSCADHWELDMGAEKISLGQASLKDFSAKLHLDRLMLSPEKTDFSIPTLQIVANVAGNDQGLLRGPLGIIQSPGKTIRVIWNNKTRELELGGLDIALNAQQVYVLPPKFLKMLDPRVRSLGIDGHFQADLDFNFGGPRETWKGSGLVSLVGDKDGDIYFLDGSGNRVGSPLVRGTHWDFMRVDRINFKRGYALGKFHLDTIFDLGALTYLSGSKLPVIAGTGNLVEGLGPYELRFEMPYDNMPVTPQGFQNRIVDYIQTICQQTPGCPEALADGGKQ